MGKIISDRDILPLDSSNRWKRWAFVRIITRRKSSSDTRLYLSAKACAHLGYPKLVELAFDSEKDILYIVPSVSETFGHRIMHNYVSSANGICSITLFLRVCGDLKIKAQRYAVECISNLNLPNIPYIDTPALAVCIEREE